MDFELTQSNLNHHYHWLVWKEIEMSVRRKGKNTKTTLCYLPPGSVDVPAFTPAEAGTRFSDPGGTQGWVDLGGGYNSEDSLPAKDGHLSQK